LCVCLILLPYRQASRQQSASFLAFVVLLLLGVYLGKRYQMRLEMKPYVNTPRTRQKSIFHRSLLVAPLFRLFSKRLLELSLFEE